jgi:dipeptidyl aminopeptidase/acylaminoacyl peptidase
VVVQGVPPIAAALAERLKPYGEFIPHSLVAWHPKRREMLVQRRGDAATQLHVVTEPGAKPVRLAELPDAIVREGNRVGEPAPAVARAIARLEKAGHVELAVSPDGRRLVSVQVVDALDSQIWITDVASGQRRRLTRPAKDDPVSYRLPRFSPDGRAVFATSDKASEWRRLVMMPVAGGNERVLTERLKFDVEDFELSADAQRITFTTNEAGSHSLRFLDLKSLEEQPRPPLFNGIITGLAWRPGSAEVAFQLTGARSAGDVFSYDVAANRLSRWTNGNSPRVNVSQFAEPRIARWGIGNGVEVTAFHYHPPERFAGRRPVLVDLREGIAQQARAGFLAERNYLVNELGIAVLHPNVRGASGLGKSFRRLGMGPRKDAGSGDLPAMLDWIRSQPDLDAERVVIAGRGHGASLALRAVSEHAARFAGVVAILPDDARLGASVTRPALWVTRSAVTQAGGETWIVKPEGEAPLSRRAENDYVLAATVEFLQKVLR